MSWVITVCEIVGFEYLSPPVHVHEGLTALPHPVSAQLFIVNVRNFNVNVDPVKQRAGDTLLLLGNSCFSTRAGLVRRAVPATWTGIHRSDELKVSWELEQTLLLRR